MNVLKTTLKLIDAEPRPEKGTYPHPFWNYLHNFVFSSFKQQQ